MTKVALVYDFDGTLAPGNMQEYGMLEALGYPNPKDFWIHCDQLSAAHEAGGILITQYAMLREMIAHGVAPTKEQLQLWGKNVQFFPGVREWFARINAYGKALGLDVQHFIDSSGLKEMIEGTDIADEFEHIYACSYIYDEKGHACWPAISVDYSTKVQFLAKISKGIRDVSDSKRVNEYVPKSERAIPMDRFIYLGDGETDVPSMRTVKSAQGHSIAIYSNENKHALAAQLMKDGRIDFACAADYSENSELDRVVKHILDGFALRLRAGDAIN